MLFPEKNASSLGTRIMHDIVRTILTIIGFSFALILTHHIVHEVNYARFAESAPQFCAERYNPETERYPVVALTGALSTPKLLGDGKHLLPGHYLHFTRIKEIYVWIEETTKYKYRSYTHYRKAWKTPGLIKPTGKFKNPTGHENPRNIKPEFDVSWPAHYFNVGAYQVFSHELQLPESTRLQLTPDNVTFEAPLILADNALYKFASPESSLSEPSIGDERTYYNVIEYNGKVATIFGRVNGGTIESAQIPAANSSNPDFAEATSDTKQHVFSSSSGVVKWRRGPAPHKKTPFKRLFWGTPEYAIAQMTITYWTYQLLKALGAFLGMLVCIWVVLVAPFSDKISARFFSESLPRVAHAPLAACAGSLAFCTLLWTLFWYNMAPVLVLLLILLAIGLLFMYLRNMPADQLTHEGLEYLDDKYDEEHDDDDHNRDQ